jgi:hypothetical protein
MSNSIDDLRTHLFDALRGLKTGSIDVEKAKAMSDVAQTIINSAKVEVEYIKASGAKGSGFLDAGQPVPSLPAGINGITQHRIKP